MNTFVLDDIRQGAAAATAARKAAAAAAAAAVNATASHESWLLRAQDIVAHYPDEVSMAFFLFSIWLTCVALFCWSGVWRCFFCCCCFCWRRCRRQQPKKDKKKE